MALYMQGSYKKPNYPAYVGKPAALVNAQMSQDVNRIQPVTIPTQNTPTYNTTGSFPTTTTQTVAQTPQASSGYSQSYSAPSLDVDLAGIWETAGMMADNEINPQLAEIDRMLREAGYSAEESTRAINEAYPVARRSLQKSIYENMVAGEGSLAAMGTGRGGGRQELLARAGEREATGIESIETQKQRELGAIDRALTNYRNQLGTQRTSLVGQRGALQATYAEQLRSNRFNEAATKASLGIQSAQLAEQARQFNESLKEYYNPTATGASGATNNEYFDAYVQDLLKDLGINNGTNTNTNPAVPGTANYNQATGGLRKAGSTPSWGSSYMAGLGQKIKYTY